MTQYHNHSWIYDIQLYLQQALAGEFNNLMMLSLTFFLICTFKCAILAAAIMIYRISIFMGS